MDKNIDVRWIGCVVTVRNRYIIHAVWSDHLWASAILGHLVLCPSVGNHCFLSQS